MLSGMNERMSKMAIRRGDGSEGNKEYVGLLSGEGALGEENGRSGDETSSTASR